MNNIISNILDILDSQKVLNILKKASKDIILPFFGKLKSNQIRTKKRTDDFVTIADQNSEEFISSELMKIFPNSSVLGEEAISKNPSLKQKLLKSKLFWTCDPIDGTFNYVNGLKNFCTMVSLCYEKKPIAGWMYFPIYGIGIISNLKHGCLIIKEDQTVIVKRINGRVKYDRFNGGELLKNVFNDLYPKKYIENYYSDRNVRCAGYESFCLANGKIDYMYHKFLTPWDHAPVDILCNSSGCKVGLLPNGNPYLCNEKRELLVTGSKESWNIISKYLI